MQILIHSCSTVFQIQFSELECPFAGARLNKPKPQQSIEEAGATAHEEQGLLCSSQHTWPLDAEVREQMSRSGGQSEERPPVFKSPGKLSTHLSTLLQ
ncbi:hypothetical protein TNCV_1647511 [Trichonephila clavipes]|nr:hypothetical protein TNCV_1647511 [Trichonephila clavipes]